MSPSSSDAEDKKKSRWGKKEKVDKETETRSIGNQSVSRADEREEADTGRKREKGPRQQFEGPHAKVVFHQFSADSAEDVLKVEGESTAPSLNYEYDVLIKVEVRYTVLFFKPRTFENVSTRASHFFIEFARRRPRPSRRMIAFCAVGLISACLTQFAYLQLRALILWATSFSVVVKWKGSSRVTGSQRW
jgi:hypothetical protein